MPLWITLAFPGFNVTNLAGQLELDSSITKNRTTNSV